MFSSYVRSLHGQGGITDGERTVGEKDAGADCQSAGRGKTDQSGRTDPFPVPA